MTPTSVCKMMNEAYEVLKTMTIEEIKQASDLAAVSMDMYQAALFRYQCKFAIMKKRTGAWSN